MFPQSSRFFLLLSFLPLAYNQQATTVAEGCVNGVCTAENVESPPGGISVGAIVGIAVGGFVLVAILSLISAHIGYRGSRFGSPTHSRANGVGAIASMQNNQMAAVSMQNNQQAIQNSMC